MQAFHTILTKSELRLLRSLNTPVKIQGYLDSLPFNHEEKGDTNGSPRQVIRTGKAHCMEGALLAAAALWLSGKPPLLMDLRAKKKDQDHVIALYREQGYWGAISKTNHAVLRFRDPIYRTLRELALSFMHEYFLIETGEKTLISYSRPLTLSRLGTGWIIEEDDLWELVDRLDTLPHYVLVPKKSERSLKRASRFERRVGSIEEWSKRRARS